MTAKEIRELSAEEVTTKLRDVRQELLHLRLRRHTGQLEKTHQLHVLRKDIARLETVVREKPRK
jgi:large subunit ribosomal protein L29